MKETAIIIGGGMGGLFTGAILARNGFKVTVLEKNHIAGGGLQCFRRKDKIFETGMHVLGGFGPDGTLTKICKYLGIDGKLRIHHLDSECMDSIYFATTGETYDIPSGREKFVERMGEYFPEEKENVKRYVDELYRLAAEVPLFYLLEDQPGIAMHSDAFFRPADEMIAEYIEDPRLRDLLAYMNPLYGGVRGHTPVYIHALLNVLYIDGTSRFIGGSQQLVEALAEVIEKAGGRLITDAEVVKVEIADKEVKYVETSDGRRYEGDRYVCAIHPRELMRLSPDGSFQKAYRRRLEEIPLTVSAFTLFIDLKPERIKYIPHTNYMVDDYGYMWTDIQSVEVEGWPRGMMYMTPPDENQGEYANRLLVHCIMDYSEVKEWEASRVGRRPESYEKWKTEKVGRVLDKLESVLPGVKDAAANVYAASPLTIRDYYHTPDGSIFGYRKDSENILLSQLNVFTKIRNLYLTGQNVNLHGICGVPLTAINTAEAILGLNSVVRSINESVKGE